MSGSETAVPWLRKRTLAVSVLPFRRNSVTSAETPGHFVSSRDRTPPAGVPPAGAGAAGAAAPTGAAVGAAIGAAAGAAAVATMPGAAAGAAVAAGRGASRLQAAQAAAKPRATTPAAFHVIGASFFRRTRTSYTGAAAEATS